MSGTNDILVFRISGMSDLGRAITALNRHAILRGASDMDQALLATMVSELASNIVKYAGRGTVRLTRRDDHDGTCIDLEARDEGPGIGNIEQATSEHFSTGGTLGLGLPGVRRMADTFDVESSAENGTLVRATKRIVHRPRRDSSSFPGVRISMETARSLQAVQSHGSQAHLDVFDVASRSRPRLGEVVSGDRALSLACDDGVLLGIIDASGHGFHAHRVASMLEHCFCEEGSSDIERLMRRFQEVSRGSAGAAAGLAFVDGGSGFFRYTGIGNTRATTAGNTDWRGISRHGVLGDRRVEPTVQSGRLSAHDVMMLWTDGLPESGTSTRSSIVSYRSAAEIALHAITSFARDLDDAACIVMRWQP